MSGFNVTVLDGGESEGTPSSVIESQQSLEEMLLFPNPTAGDVVQVRWNSSVSGIAAVEIFDLRGSIAAQMESAVWIGQNQVEMNIGHFERGYYLVQLTFNNERFTQRLIVQ